MGMFDALMIEIDDHPVELQTKHFDNILGYYHLGDKISGAPSGVSVYYDLVDMNDEGKQTYNGDEKSKSYTVFIVLVQGVFTDFTVESDELDNPVIESLIKKLHKYWSDSAHILLAWLDFLNNKQKTISVLNRQIRDVQGVIDYSRKLDAGVDMSKKHLFLETKETKLLQKGEEPLTVIESVLNNKDPELLFGIRAFDDPLQSYRL